MILLLTLKKIILFSYSKTEILWDEFDNIDKTVYLVYVDVLEEISDCRFEGTHV